MPPPPRAGTNTDSSDSQQSTSNGSEQTADNDADKPGQSSDGWLEGEPTGGNGDQGEWQTSNQGIPDGSGDADASGSADATEAAGDDTKNGADQALAEALEGLDGEILAERAVLREAVVPTPDCPTPVCSCSPFWSDGCCLRLTRAAAGEDDRGEGQSAVV